MDHLAVLLLPAASSRLGPDSAHRPVLDLVRPHRLKAYPTTGPAARPRCRAATPVLALAMTERGIRPAAAPHVGPALLAPYRSRTFLAVLRPAVAMRDQDAALLALRVLGDPRGLPVCLALPPSRALRSGISRTVSTLAPLPPGRVVERRCEKRWVIGSPTDRQSSGRASPSVPEAAAIPHRPHCPRARSDVTRRRLPSGPDPRPA